MIETVTLGGGCFWCTEAIFQRLKGVSTVVSGYAGGEDDNPVYEAVCQGVTGHAEVIQITYEPDEVSFKELVLLHFATHDPTTLNQQGADKGTQYRSVIFTHNDQQQQEAEQLIERLAGSFSDPIVTEVVPLKQFYKAEAYHQNYYNENVNAGYCQAVIAPKLAKLEALFS